MSVAVEVLLDRLSCTGDWRSFVHMVLTRARRQYTPADLATALLDWVLREDLPAVLQARGHVDAGARVRSLGVVFNAPDVAIRRGARQTMFALLPELAGGLRASDPVAAEACARAERCASYSELHPIGNNLRPYLSWVENEAARTAATLRLFATLAGDASQGRTAVLIHLTTGEAVALWVTLRGGPEGALAEDIQRLRERVPPEIAAEVGFVDPPGDTFDR